MKQNKWVRPVSKRIAALGLIYIEYATPGHETQASMRAYIENNISGAARRKTIRAGLKNYRDKQ